MSLGFAEVNEAEPDVAPWLHGISQSGSFRETVLSETAGDIIDAREIFRKRIINNVPVWIFKDEDHFLKAKKAIIIYVKHGMGHYYVENETLDIYATGDSYAAAFESFKEHLIYFYQHYKSLTWEEVTGEAERLKKSFDELFVEEG